eukprot:12005887-Alexandrium_andersonii.AAC.1
MAAVPRHGGGHRTVRGWSGRRRTGRHAGPPCGRHGGSGGGPGRPPDASWRGSTPTAAYGRCRRGGPGCRTLAAERPWAGGPHDDGRTRAGRGRCCVLAGVDGAHPSARGRFHPGAG